MKRFQLENSLWGRTERQAAIFKKAIETSRVVELPLINGNKLVYHPYRLVPVSWGYAVSTFVYYLDAHQTELEPLGWKVVSLCDALDRDNVKLGDVFEKQPECLVYE